MPMYYFNFWDGQWLDAGECGVKLNGLRTAFEMASQTAKRQMLADGLLKSEDRSRWASQGIDERSHAQFTFEFSKALAEPYYSQA
jgi:hypothetical protein